MGSSGGIAIITLDKLNENWEEFLLGLEKDVNDLKDTEIFDIEINHILSFIEKYKGIRVTNVQDAVGKLRKLAGISSKLHRDWTPTTISTYPVEPVIVLTWGHYVNCQQDWLAQAAIEYAGATKLFCWT